MKSQYTQFIEERNVTGSGKASSYIRAINLLCPILQKNSKEFACYADIWSIDSVEVISALYDYVIDQQKLFKQGQGIFVEETPVSYWRDGYCSAALKSYREFLVLMPYEQNMWDIVGDDDADPAEVSRRLQSQELDSAEQLIEDDGVDLSSKEGREALRTVKTRVNQNFFRKMILEEYNTQCCVTGLNIPDVLRASHIVGWAQDTKNRLNPSNGLCLSATYDAAFDRHLISFDDDYRMILSSSLKEYCSNKAFKEHFQKLEGHEITLPNRYKPDKVLLEKHRNKTFG